MSGVAGLHPAFAFVDGGGFIAATLPVIATLRNDCGDISIADCVAAEYGFIDRNRSRFPEGSEDKFKHWRCGTLSDLNSTASEFLPVAAEEIQFKYERLVQEFEDQLRQSGKLDDSADFELSVSDEYRLGEKAEQAFVAEYEWPPERDLNSYLAVSISLLKRKLRSKVDVKTTEAPKLEEQASAPKAESSQTDTPNAANPRKKSAMEAMIDEIEVPDVTGLPDIAGTEKVIEAPQSQESNLHDATEQLQAMLLHDATKQLQAMHTQPERDGSRDLFVRTPPSKPVQPIVEWDADDPRLK